MKTLFMLFIIIGLTQYNYAQNTSIKSTPSGNGPILSGLKIDDVKLVNSQGNLESLGIGSMLAKGEVVTTRQVRVDVRYSGKITQYKYKGKTYKAELKNKDCTAKCFDCSSRHIKMTAKIQVAGKVLTASDEAIAPFPASAMFKFDKSIPFKDVKLLSVVIEPVPYPKFENELQKYEACVEKQEKKEAEEKEPKTETDKTDDDFWSGGKEETPKRKIVLNTSNDFWSGSNKDKTTSNKKVGNDDFWSGKEDLEPDNKNNISQKEKKDKTTKSITYYWVFIHIHTHNAIYCASEGIGDHMYTTNIFRVPIDIVDGKEVYINEEYKTKIRTLLKELFPQYSDKCLRYLEDSRIHQYTTLVYDRIELERNRQEVHNPQPKSWTRKGIQRHLVNDFYPFGK